MSTPEVAMRLLLASDEGLAEESRALAAQLNAENLRRQKEEQEILEQARRIVQTDPDVGARAILVVAGEGWHRGVIGIVASKLVDAFYRPVIMLSIEGDVAHGSCRSIPAFDMLGALERCGTWLTRFGGHRQAAGLTLARERIKPFREAVAAWADEALGPDDLVPRLRIDAALPLTGITGDLVEQIMNLEPFGPGNPRPVFHATRVQVVDGPRRLKDRHLKLAVRQNGRTFRAVAWRAAERESFYQQHRGAVDLAFSLVRNEYNGETAVELTVADAKQPASVDGGP
jgi:single-stranded-DNA-specific exonuclease